MGKMVGIAEFKAKAERLLREMERDGEPIELTRRGKVVGVVRPPAAPRIDPDSLFGCMRGTMVINGDLDESINPDWEAEWGAKWDARGLAAPAKPE